jgi:hypothetical protein
MNYFLRSCSSKSKKQNCHQTGLVEVEDQRELKYFSRSNWLCCDLCIGWTGNKADLFVETPSADAI